MTCPSVPLAAPDGGALRPILLIDDEIQHWFAVADEDPPSAWAVDLIARVVTAGRAAHLGLPLVSRSEVPR
jgi:hypothetical protein